MAKDGGLKRLGWLICREAELSPGFLNWIQDLVADAVKIAVMLLKYRCHF